MADLRDDALAVLIVDDDPLVRSGLRMLLAGDRGIKVAAEASDGDEVAGLIANESVDVILMDVRMPRLDGIEAVRRMQEDASAPPVIMLTTFDADGTVLEAVRAGAAGFLVKHAAPESIIAAVHQAAAGEPVFSPSVLRALVGHARTGSQPERSSTVDTLGERERTIAVRVAQGMSNTEIAAQLFLSTGTVKADVSAMLAKLGLSNRIQLAIFAHEQLDSP